MQGLYQITNTINGHFYVGSSVDIEQRWCGHKTDLNKGKHCNAHLQNAWNKYGAQAFSFEVLCELGEHQLQEAETNLLGQIVGLPICYNISRDAVAGMRGWKHSSEIRARNAEAQRGRKHTPSHCAKIAETMRGHSISVETRAKIAEALRGRKHSAEARARMCLVQKALWTSAVRKKHSEIMKHVSQRARYA